MNEPDTPATPTPAEKPNPPMEPVHYEWGFRNEALRWDGGAAAGVNFETLAKDMALWMRREIHHLNTVDERARLRQGGFTNPYTYHGSSICLALAHTINDISDFVESTKEIAPLDAEVRRVRLFNEQIIYIARFCEAAIKQLLYCTQVPTKHYAEATMGGLLASPCKPCKAAGVSHQVSHLGSLAHRYFLCSEMDNCVEVHLRLANRRRNTQAAHSESQALNPRTAAESRAQLERDMLEIGNEFVHMLGHIGDLETRMKLELESEVARLRGWPVSQLRFAIRSSRASKRRQHEYNDAEKPREPPPAGTN